MLEHMVDAVLCFEGEKQMTYRVIRAAKNRFGSTNEIGVFEMTGAGLAEVPNPSEALLEGRPKNMSGNCAVCVIEGTRPIIAEIQALARRLPFLHHAEQSMVSIIIGYILCLQYWKNVSVFRFLNMMFI